MSTRDSQRSRVYAWERTCADVYAGRMSREDAEALVARVWLAERARYGRGRLRPPSLRHRGRGARGYYYSNEVSLGSWARTPWIVCHEVAHVLVGPKGGWHGPRFVACLIGIAARHLDHDASRLMELADRGGVKYLVQSIGAVPQVGLPARLARLMPVGYMHAAAELDVSYRQVYGAALSLVREGRARWRGKTLVPVDAVRRTVV